MTIKYILIQLFSKGLKKLINPVIAYTMSNTKAEKQSIASIDYEMDQQLIQDKDVVVGVES